MYTSKQLHSIAVIAYIAAYIAYISAYITNIAVIIPIYQRRDSTHGQT